MKYCSDCGHTLTLKIPEMDNRERHVCESCGSIHYLNPKVIVGTVPVFQDKVLLCRRAIEPRLGYWTLPAGFLENHESTEEGAKRETLEEAGVHYERSSFFRVLDIPHISQVYIFYLAELDSMHHCAGEESLEVNFFTENDIPWKQLAFPVMGAVLKDYFRLRL